MRLRHIPEQPVCVNVNISARRAKRREPGEFSFRGFSSLGGRAAGIARRVNGIEVPNEMLGGDEPRHRDGQLDRYRRRSLWCGYVADLANLALLLVGGLRVPVGKRVRGQRAQRKDERYREYASADSLPRAQLA
jgi:hypothetical protein